MTASITTHRPDASSWLAETISRIGRTIESLLRAGDQTRADLGRAESERARERRLARDTAQARAVEARHAWSDPGFAADIRAAIDRHELQTRGLR